MASVALSAGQIVLYVLLPIISFSTLVMVVYYCYRRRRCCFATKEEALLGNSEKNRFTVDMGKRKRRNNSFTSNSWDSFETKQNDHYQHMPTGRSQQFNNNHEKTIIPSKIARPDIKRSVVVGQANTKDTNLLAGPYLPTRRATSPAQSLPDFNYMNPTTEDLYRRHYSYDASISKSSVYNTSETDRQRNLLDRKSGVFTSDENYGKKSPSSLRRLRHQGRVKGTENEPSFSRPTNKPRVSLVLTSASFDLSSSGESDNEVHKNTRPHQIHSPSTADTRNKKRTQTKTKDVLQPARRRKSSSSSDRGGRSPSTQYSGRSSPAILEAVDEVDAAFARRSPNIRSTSSPVSSQQSSLDMNALQAALGQHRKSDGDVLSRNPKLEDENERIRPDGLRRARAISQSSMTGGRRTGASNQIPNIAPTLLVNTEAYQGRQGRRRSSMQNPIDLSQINPRLYENTTKPPSMDFDDVDVELPQIHFTLDYNHDLEVLTVKLIQARNLETQAFSGTCDPYCTVAITPGFNARQSKVHRRTTDPEFEEKFSFSINQEDMRLKTLEIRTYDFDQFSRDECTGVMEMKLDSVDFGMDPHYDLWKKFRVEDLQASQMTEIFGDLMLALSYLPSAEKLTVAIQKARNLKSPEGRKGPPDPYIKASIFRGNQRLKKKKTDTIQSTYNPVFNQALTFSVSPELLQCPMLRITCQAVHDQTLAANADLGYLEIGPGSKEEEERMHWRDVTGKNSNKPVARWHKLHAPDMNAEESKGSFLNLANARRFSTTLSFQQNEKDSGKASPSPGRRSLT